MQSSSLLPRLKTCLLSTVIVIALSNTSLAQEGYGELPPPAVGVLEMKAHDVPVVNELPGRVAATRVSEVRARVSGILQERVFEQGAAVKAGDVLYRIDPRLFRVRVASAEAALQRAKAVQANARQQLERQRALREKSLGTGIDLDTASVNLAQADADVAAAEAGLEEAKINLDYTEVRAPISGIIGGALVTEGALVTAEGSSSLALIQQVDPVYADFTQSAQALLDLKRAVGEGRLASAAPGQASVKLILDNGSPYEQPGKLLFANASVDSNTGQVTLRAEFPNPQRDLLPGMYVRVRIEQAVRQNAFTIPQRAVIRDESGNAVVYVVGADNKAEARPVKLGQSLGSEWVVEDGLKQGETVIVDGAQKVQPDAAVAPEPWSPTSDGGGDAREQAQQTQAGE
jgi:membrane fusion protein (multidrug efflux system)